MANLAEIKSAKKLGECLKKARELQCMSILNLAKLSGLSINQLVNLENGNFFAFGQNMSHFEANVNHCAEKMGVSISISITQKSSEDISSKSSSQSIPIFLRQVT